ncbi:unnamed protein product [Trifolium pratense]|uniref:Uncharacterized protein n=1 Tax=Trifolium pratense TaxID=57577 RepID=A0ACB0L0U6_TRIPR|nr:unnamed protein product [Trifolium pratense]
MLGFWQQLWVFVVPKVHLVSWTRSRMIELVSKGLATLEGLYKSYASFFSAFGTVQKIAMFEKNGQTQALIQYPDVTTAAAAREALEGHCIYDGSYCKLHLSYSRHTDLNVKAFSDKSRDYTVPQVPVTSWQNPQAAPMYPTSSLGFQTQVPGGQGPSWDLTQHAVRPGYVPVPGAYPVQNGAYPTMPAYASATMPTASWPLAQRSHPGVPPNVNLQPSGGSTSGPGSSPHMQTSFGAQGLVRPGVQPNARPGGDSPSGQHYYG